MSAESVPNIHDFDAVDRRGVENTAPLFVTKSYLPKYNRIQHYIDRACSQHRLTNRGPLEQLLTERLQRYLEVDNLLLVANGTLALQLAQAALGVKSPSANAITTPFSFVATASSLLWEGIEPRFSDIERSGLCMDATKISSKVDGNTRAIVPVHVYGNACDIESIENVAQHHKLKTIYDGSHAFGVRYRNRSILGYGDATTLSFHATKLFHTVEGGAIVFNDTGAFDIAKEMSSFGYRSGSIKRLGINAKLSEIHAAFGLAVLEDIDVILNNRAIIWHRYQKALACHVNLPAFREGSSANYAYFPVILDSETSLHRIMQICEAQGIHPRRYFHPSLNTLEFMPDRNVCPVSESMSSRTICLPLYPDLEKSDQQRIIETVLHAL